MLYRYYIKWLERQTKCQIVILRTFYWGKKLIIKKRWLYIFFPMCKSWKGGIVTIINHWGIGDGKTDHAGVTDICTEGRYINNIKLSSLTTILIKGVQNNNNINSEIKPVSSNKH